MLRYLFIILWGILVMFNTSIASSKLKIKILSNNNISELFVAPGNGDYEIWSNNKLIAQLTNDNVLIISIKDSIIELKTLTTILGKVQSLSIRQKSDSNYFKLRAITPLLGILSYNGDLLINRNGNSLQLINEVEIEDYISGVVQSEGGYSNFPEYFKAHAVIVRTYTLKHIDRHETDGFNLCDQVHCQAYNSRTKNKTIINAVKATRDTVLVDSTKTLIMAVYHANSGGQTMNSEDVWTNKSSYLRSVNDTFALSKPSAYWEKEISKNEWFRFLNEKYQISLNDSLSLNHHLKFDQPYRKSFYEVSSIKIPLNEIRKYFNLRSTFFSFSKVNNKLLFKGRGYGHGVGFSQEGAKRMAELGYNYKQILGYYYTNIFIIKNN